MKNLGLSGDELEDLATLTASKSLLKRFGTPEEVARVARFLLPPDSSNIAGSETVIDGGVRLAT
jgi:NAD(P)-dependent dehydrogenase (short-subunit alcohol dehydrogenase family)